MNKNDVLFILSVLTNELYIYWNANPLKPNFKKSWPDEFRKELKN
jgi:hypothetical protein